MGARRTGSPPTAGSPNLPHRLHPARGCPADGSPSSAPGTGRGMERGDRRGCGGSHACKRHRARDGRIRHLCPPPRHPRGDRGIPVPPAGPHPRWRDRARVPCPGHPHRRGEHPAPPRGGRLGCSPGRDRVARRCALPPAPHPGRTVPRPFRPLGGREHPRPRG